MELIVGIKKMDWSMKDEAGNEKKGVTLYIHTLSDDISTYTVGTNVESYGYSSNEHKISLDKFNELTKLNYRTIDQFRALKGKGIFIANEIKIGGDGKQRSQISAILIMPTEKDIKDIKVFG